MGRPSSRRRLAKARTSGFTDDPAHFNPADTGEGFRRAVLEQLRRAGSDTKRRHGFDFLLYLPTKEAARQAAATAQHSEFSVRVARAGPGKGWRCHATIEIVPEDAPLEDIGRFFQQLAAALGGEFDGWEAAES
jgi:hypothetical protein